MCLIKHWIAKLTVIGFGLMAVCPSVFSQSVFDDTEPDATAPKAEWRQKVLHNKAPQQTVRASAQDGESRSLKWSPYPNSSPDSDRNTNILRSENAVVTQDVEYRTAQRSSYQSENRARMDGISSAPNTRSKNIRIAQREVPAAVDEDPGATRYEPLAAEGSFAPHGGGCASGGACSCGGDDSCCGECEDCGECECPWMMGWGPRNLAIFAGVNGYKGPRDRGGNGNFGFTEGMNFGAPLGDPWGCGYQLGFAALQDNLSGYQQSIPIDNTNQSAILTADRHQYFFTAGIFNRAECSGWQWGVAFDLLHDTYYETSDLKQIRTETGYLFNECFEVGYSGAYGIGGDRVQNTLALNQRQTALVNAFLNPTDQFMVYFRRHFANGGDGRIWGGITGYSDGLFGADAWVPLGGSWAIQNTFNYLIPKNGKGENGQVNESWSLAVNLVWYPGRSAQCLGTSCYRPLLNVADNSLFMVRENRQTTIVNPQ
jgi:hypothetical protein